MVKHNLKLQHLNLSYTGMSQYMLLQFGPALRRSRSLLALHLSGNPGLSQDLKSHLHQRTHSQPYIDPINISLIADIALKKKLYQGLEIQNTLRQGVKMKELVSQKEIKFEGHAKLDFNENHILGFERLLGHKQDMPGHAQWRQIINSRQKCWFCSDYVYTLIFWSKEVGWLDNNKIEPQVEEEMIKRLELIQRNFETLQEEEVEVKGKLALLLEKPERSKEDEAMLAELETMQANFDRLKEEGKHN